MNRFLTSVLALGAVASAFTSCTQDKDDDNTPGVLPDTTVKIYTVAMGAQTSAANYHMHDVDSNGTYNISYFNANKNIIDLIYYFAETGSDNYCISSPNNPDLLSVSAYAPFINSGDLATACNTQIRKVSALSATEFNQLVDGNEVKNIYDGAGTTSVKATNVTTGSIWAVKLQTGMYGVFKVDAINGSTASSDIALTIKVQQ